MVGLPCTPNVRQRISGWLIGTGRISVVATHVSQEIVSVVCEKAFETHMNACNARMLAVLANVSVSAPLAASFAMSIHSVFHLLCVIVIYICSTALCAYRVAFDACMLTFAH